ncbi:aldo/keto reductase [Saccharopolyspora rosea]|uniref:Aldo/keto reductase n=1 Tax=Saccharopolyspora rosea TaxID=524884 RepID=A0ABW3G4M8_9PSEU
MIPRSSPPLPRPDVGSSPCAPAGFPLSTNGFAFCQDSTRPTAVPTTSISSHTGLQRKIDAVEALVALAEEAGLSLTHLALGFTLTHPAVATVFLGPRTPEQLEDLLAGTETRLPDDVLDRIDAIVPPGENIPATYSGRANPALLDPTLRRRS